MDGTIKACLRTLGFLLLLSVLSAQAHASFPQKTLTDLSSALEVAKQDLRDVVQNYESEFQQRIAFEDAYFDQTENPQSNVVAAHLRK